MRSETAHAELCSEINRLSNENARLIAALAQQHLALSAIGCRIQNDRGEWKIRKPHDDMPALLDRLNKALVAYHDTMREEKPNADA